MIQNRERKKMKQYLKVLSALVLLGSVAHAGWDQSTEGLKWTVNMETQEPVPMLPLDIWTDGL